MDAFTVAAEMLGGLSLTSGQLAQLRAIDRKFFQEVYTRLHPSEEEGQRADTREQSVVRPAESSLTARQNDELRAMLERDVRELLTPEQRALLDRDRAP
jgi:Spy/CpxP family protein refolding chaperone